MTHTLPFLSALSRQATSRIPIWCMRQAGRYLPEYRELRKSHPDFLSLCYHPADAAKVTLQPLRRFDLDAAILFSDILVMPHALGRNVRFEAGEGPRLDPILPSEIAQLDTSRIESHLSPMGETLDRLRQSLPAHVALIGFAGAPWTIACYMIEGKGSRDFATVRQWALQHREAFSTLIDIITDATIRYFRLQIDAGAQALQLFDSWAGVLTPREWSQWVIPPTRRIVEAIRQTHPQIPLIGFPKGMAMGLLPFVQQTGVSGISLDSQTDRRWAKQNLQPLATLQGNLDSLLLAHDLPAALEETSQIIEEWGQGPFIFNLGHGIIPQTPPENLSQVINKVRSCEKTR